MLVGTATDGVNTSNTSDVSTTCTSEIPLWSEETVEDSCNLVPYEGTICQDILQMWELCAVGTRNVQLLASANDDQESVEAFVVNFKGILSKLAIYQNGNTIDNYSYYYSVKACTCA